MPSTKYTDEQRNAFLELAAKVGPGEAREQLGYPSESAATRWAKQAGTTFETVPDVIRGGALTAARSDAAIISVGDKLLDAIESVLDDGRPIVTKFGVLLNDEGEPVMMSPPPDDLAKLAQAYHRTVEARRLVEGKSTANVHLLAEMHDSEREKLERARTANKGVLAALGAA